jgi:hypothetical protein
MCVVAMTWRCAGSKKQAKNDHLENSQVIAGAFKSWGKEQFGIEGKGSSERECR